MLQTLPPPAPVSPGLPLSHTCSATEALNRTAPGPEGSICTIVPSLNNLNANCAANLTCVPLPEASATRAALAAQEVASSRRRAILGFPVLMPPLAERRQHVPPC